MSVSRLEMGLWGAAVAFGATALFGARAPHDASRDLPTAAHVRAPGVTSVVDVDRAASALIAADPFRAARRPSPIAYRPELDGAPPPPPPSRAPRPMLGISGIIGGPPWSAVLEGVPGRDAGAVVHAGDTLGGGLRVRAVKRDSVVITGMDTTWRLIVRRAW